MPIKAILSLRLSLLFIFVGAAIAHAVPGRYPPLDPAVIREYASANGELWRKRAMERGVLPGIGPDGRSRFIAHVNDPSPVLGEMKKALIERARFLATQPIPEYRTPAQRVKEGHGTIFDMRQELWMRPLGDDLVLLSFAAAMESDPIIISRVHDLVLALCGYPQWGERKPNQDLSAGHVARGIAIAWAWHKEIWSASEQAWILETIRTRVGALCGVVMDGTHWAGAFLENHNHVGAAGLGICGAVFINDLPKDGALWLAAADLNFREVARYFYADGSSPEGVPYWGYGVSFLLQYIECARGITDADTLYDMPFMRAMAAYRLHSATSGFGQVVPWGDASVQDSYGPHHILYRLAAQFKDAETQYFATKLPFAPQGGADVQAWTWLWHAPTLAGIPPRVLDAHMPVLDTITTRSGWGRGDYVLAIKSGFTNRNHSHLDAGAIALSFGNEWLLPTPGYGNGRSEREFWQTDGPRWDYFSNATESHTTLLINSRNQRWDEDSRGTVRRFSSAPDIMWAEVDLQGAYAGAKSVWRRVLHRRGDYAILLDDVRLFEPGRVEWLLQLPAASEVNGRTAHVEGGAGLLDVSMVVPAKNIELRRPKSPKIDMPANRLVSYAVATEGIVATFRSLLAFRFAGSLLESPSVKRGDGDSYVIESREWRDEIIFLDNGVTDWENTSGELVASARLITTRAVGGHMADFFAEDALGIITPVLDATWDAPRSVAGTRINDDLWLLEGFDRMGGDLKLTKPWKLYWVHADGGNEVIDENAPPSGVKYALLAAKERGAVLKYGDWLKGRIAVRSEPGIPVRQLAPLPLANIKSNIRIEAERYAAEVFGQVDVVNKPGDHGGSLRGFGGGSSFHTLTWKVTVPESGSYRMRLRYCTPNKGTQISVLVNGAAPTAAAVNVILPETAGWSVESDNWREFILQDTDGISILLPLEAGEHEISLTRPSSPVNIDLFELIGGRD